MQTKAIMCTGVFKDSVNKKDLPTQEVVVICQKMGNLELQT